MIDKIQEIKSKILESGIDGFSEDMLDDESFEKDFMKHIRQIKDESTSERDFVFGYMSCLADLGLI